jgi:short-subunit dehydrogenase
MKQEEQEKKQDVQLKLKKYNVEVMSVSKDLFNRDAAFELYNKVKAKGIEIDVLVNNAGQGEYGEFVDTDIDRELDIIQLKYWCSYNFNQALFLRYGIRRKWKNC